MDIVQQTASKNQYSLILDDIIHWAESYQGEPFHAILTDPPYHLTSITKRFGKPGSAPAKGGVYGRSSAGFMGKSWDGTDESGQGIAFKPETWAALAEHLYPGGFIMAFAGTRGYHRMACAMEDAGLIIHPALGFLFGTGFPKATQISNQIDRDAGLKGKKVGTRIYAGGHVQRSTKLEPPIGTFKRSQDERAIIEPALPLAQTWAGHRYGLQALKPAFEFIAVAQKPYEGRPVDCITTTGAGAWNIDGGRISTDGEEISVGFAGSKRRGIHGEHEGWMRPWKLDGEYYASKIEARIEEVNQKGRWPANLLLDESGVELLDRQSLEQGVHGAGHPDYDRTQQPYEASSYHITNSKQFRYGDSGGASRFFFQSHWAYEVFEQIEASDPVYYTSKPSSAEREAGLDSLPIQTRNRVNSGGLENEPRFAPTQVKNNHPTVKSISLNKYLATLLLPPDAYAPRRILVPFMGSGSEVCGAILAGWDEVVGIEANPDYHRIAEVRLKWWSKWPGWGQTEVDKILAAARPKEEEPEVIQMEMF